MDFGHPKKHWRTLLRTVFISTTFVCFFVNSQAQETTSDITSITATWSSQPVTDSTSYNVDATSNVESSSDIPDSSTEPDLGITPSTSNDVTTAPSTSVTGDDNAETFSSSVATDYSAQNSSTVAYSSTLETDITIGGSAPSSTDMGATTSGPAPSSMEPGTGSTDADVSSSTATSDTQTTTDAATAESTTEEQQGSPGRNNVAIGVGTTFGILGAAGIAAGITYGIKRRGLPARNTEYSNLGESVHFDNATFETSFGGTNDGYSYD